jgi:hypothetical protein
VDSSFHLVKRPRSTWLARKAQSLSIHLDLSSLNFVNGATSSASAPRQSRALPCNFPSETRSSFPPRFPACFNKDCFLMGRGSFHAHRRPPSSQTSRYDSRPKLRRSTTADQPPHRLSRIHSYRFLSEDRRQQKIVLQLYVAEWGLEGAGRRHVSVSFVVFTAKGAGGTRAADQEKATASEAKRRCEESCQIGEGGVRL